MADAEKKANEYMQQAEKKLAGSKTFLGGLFGRAGGQDEAIECYTRAANNYKIAKKWSHAGNAFSKAADVHTANGNKHDAASSHVDAGTCFKKTDPNEAINSLTKAIEIYTDLGRFNMAAKHHITVAEIFESDSVDIEKAMQHYEQAADYYKGEESTTSANRCMLTVARYAAQLEQYDKAIKIYEEVAGTCIESSLLKYSAKEYFFRAALCHMCVDLLNAQIAVKKYEEQFPSYTDTRESKLIHQLIDKIEAQDLDGFTEAVTEYDSISRLDQWFTTILLRIKKNVEGEPDLR